MAGLNNCTEDIDAPGGGSVNILKRSSQSIALIATLALVPCTSRAGSIIYTWHEDDGQNVSGSFIVSSEALQDGLIQFADLQSFSFAGVTQVGYTFEGFVGFATAFPIPISSADGVPTSNTNLFDNLGFGNGIGVSLTVTFNPESFTHDGGEWIYAQYSPFGAGPIATGIGHWTAAVVPEPSSLVSAGLACVCGIAYGAARKRGAARKCSNPA
jgi:hypothetical protein